MDPDTAKRLLVEGGLFIFLNVPEGTEFGIDMKSWNTGEKFRGVKMIPPGVHYIFYSSVSNTGDTAPRTGFFHNFKRSEVLVKKWDEKTESISDEVIPEGEVVRLKENIKALDGFLGPYPYDIHEKWLNLTSSITDNLVQKLTPMSGLITSALELESCTDADRPRGKKLLKPDDSEASAASSSQVSKKARMSGDLESELLPDLKPKPGTDIQLTSFPLKTYPEGSTPAEITKHSLDSSYVLDTIVAMYNEPSEVIGELQFCFICFLVGHSLEAFEQWKRFVNLFCSCEAAIKRYRKLYDLFISQMEIQIKEVPEEFLADIVSNNNFVYVKFRMLFRAMQNSDVDGELKTKVERFKKSLSGAYMWDFGHLDSEEEDEAPVIVDIDA